MVINASLAFVGKGDDFIEKCGISGFRNVFVNCREQPESVIRAVGGMTCLPYIGGVVRCVFMPRIMGEFYKRRPPPLSTCAESMKRIFSYAISGARWMIP